MIIIILPKPGQKSVTISGQILKELNKAYDKEKEKRPTISFASFISETAIIELERRNMLQTAQYLSLIGFQDNVLYLKDAKKGKIIEIYLKNKKLFCQKDGFNCIHIGFALALPEVLKVIQG